MFWLIVAAGFIAWIFLFLPSILYLVTTGKKRFDNLLARFNDDAVQLYFEKYFPSETPLHGDRVRSTFVKKMKRHYGRRQYIMPLSLLIVTTGIVLTMITISALKWQGLEPGFPSLPAIAASALLGAFMWTAYDQIDRFGTGDLTPNGMYACTYRFLIAVPMGYGFAFTVQEPVGIPLAFFLGTFPAGTLMTLGRRFVTKKMDLGDQPAAEKGELELIQGINKPEAERYREEGITSILQLAYTDPVDLTMRTNYEFNFVVDCMSQALLWIYLDKSIDLGKLRILGLRGAYEAKVLNEMLRSDDPEQKQNAEDNLTEVAKILGVEKRAFRKTLLEVAEDPYTGFLFNIWN